MDTIRAYAKLNLTLRVTGRRGDYHTLESAVATISLADEVRLLDDDCEPGVTWRAGAVPIGAIPGENNCLKAIRLLARAAGRRGAAVAVTRHIPDRGGLGGSSAQAAGALRLLCARWGVSPDDPEVGAIADAIGSDVRVLLAPGLALLGGRGERVERQPIRPELHFVVAQSGQSSTAAVFRAYDARPAHSGADAGALFGALAGGGWAGIGNDLTAAATAIEPRIGGVLAQIAATRPLAAGMTGSGAACFGAFAAAADAETAASSIRADFVTVCRAAYGP